MIDTKSAAHELHNILVTLLRLSGMTAFSVASSSLFMGEKGADVVLSEEPITHAFRLGLTPVFFGDVAINRMKGACILSTESVCIGIARSLGRLRVTEAQWLGTTAGVLEARRQRKAVFDRGKLAELGHVVGTSADVDVTGGMCHRVESFFRLQSFGYSA